MHFLLKDFNCKCPGQFFKKKLQGHVPFIWEAQIDFSFPVFRLANLLCLYTSCLSFAKEKDLLLPLAVSVPPPPILAPPASEDQNGLQTTSSAGM